MSRNIGEMRSGAELRQLLHSQVSRTLVVLRARYSYCRLASQEGKWKHKNSARFLPRLRLPVPGDNYVVSDVMTREVVSVSPSTALLDAALLLRASVLRHLPVVEGGRLVGILTERDVQRCAPSRLIPITEDGYNAVFAETTVARVMTREPKTVSSLTPLLEAIGVMQQSKYGCLPVVDDGKLMGILTRGDLIDALQRVLTEKPIAKDVSPLI